MITIGSSDVPVILGIAPWKDASAWTLQAKLIGLIPRYSDASTPAQARGHMMEAAILARYALETGAVLRPGPPIGSPPTMGPEPWMACRVDAYGWLGADHSAMTPERPDLVVEAKSTRNLAEWRSAVPPAYRAQVRWQLACTGLPFADLAAFGMHDDGWMIARIDRDEETERRLVGRVRHWYRRHVLEGVMCDPDGSEATARAMARAYRGVTGETVEATATDLEQVRRLRAIDEAIGELKEHRTQTANELRARMGTATAIMDGPRAIVRWGERKGRTSIDQQRLRELDPVLAKRVTKTGAPSRALTIPPIRTTTP